jgi:hypothetical protein
VQLAKFPFFFNFFSNRNQHSVHGRTRRHGWGLEKNGEGRYPGTVRQGTFSNRPPTFAASPSAGAQNYFGASGMDKWRDDMTVVMVRSEFKESIALDKSRPSLTLPPPKIGSL